MNKKKIYIASPYTLGDVATNVRNQIDAANALIQKGYAPYTPLLAHFHHIVHWQDWDTWMEIGLSFLVKCDGVLRLEGESKGADIEVAIAKKENIPVYYSIDEL